MIKILYLYPDINLTCGISKTIYLIATNIEENYQTQIFCLGGDGIEKFKKAKIDIIVFPVQKRRLIQTCRVFIKLFSIVRIQKIDIIHSHHRYFDLLAHIISKFISIETITSVQSKVYGKKHLSYKSKILIACSNCIKEHLIKYFKIDPKKIQVIHNFIDLSEAKIQMDKDVLKRELGIEDKTIVISFIGRFSIREKGIDVLLEAFRRISHEYANLKLILIGEGDDKNYIDNFIAKHPINAITLPPKENIFDYYNMIDIVVLPSRVEPFGIVAIEAGLIKKAFIGSNVDGLKEIITDGTDGILFEKENVESLAQNLKKLIDNRDLRTILGEALHQKVIKNFTSGKIVQRYEKIYNQILTK